MAKLGSYFGLCPIIDQSNLLGINEDCDPENVLVTLGRNIVIRYKLSDQKQLQSWRTKDKFSSPVIFYTEEDSYCAAFNQTYLRTWKDEENLDKLRKHKFQKQIHTLLSCGGKSFIVFRDGDIVLLKEAFERRKELCRTNIINEQKDVISDVLSTCSDENVYIGLLIKSAKQTFLVWTVFRNNDRGPFKKLHLDKPNVDLKGCVLAQVANPEMNLLTIWSDGKLYAQQLETEAEDTFLAVTDSLLCKENVTMTALNEDYIAMYGDNCNQEGAGLIIYNVQFKVTQSRQTFKMFASGTKLWRLHGNLFLCVGQNLAVVPYHLDTEQLAALVGSHKIKIDDDADITIVQDVVEGRWCDTGELRRDETIDNELKRDIEEFITLGLSESAICEELFPKYMDAKNLGSIREALNVFTDIPEMFIVKLLNFVISAEDNLFEPDEKTTKVPIQLGPMDRSYLLDKLLMLRCSDVLLLRQLRKHLDMPNALLLLRYICYLLSEDGHDIHGCDIAETERKLVEWGAVLLDANFQKILLSRDVKIVEMLIYFNGLVKAHLCCLDELQQVAPILIDIKKGGSGTASGNASMKYSIEEMKLS